jgi:hypothetical protein
MQNRCRFFVPLENTIEKYAIIFSFWLQKYEKGDILLKCYKKYACSWCIALPPLASQQAANLVASSLV